VSARSTIFLVSLWASAAVAADSARGFAIFSERCARCHTAQHDARERRAGQAPDLVLRVKQKEGAVLNAWILQPAQRAVKDSACDTRALVDDRAGLADLWAWVQGRVEAPPPPRVDRRRGDVDRVDVRKWRNRARGVKP
jgi:mono/diheme cytochrome c family protein